MVALTSRVATAHAEAVCEPRTVESIPRRCAARL